MTHHRHRLNMIYWLPLLLAGLLQGCGSAGSTSTAPTTSGGGGTTTVSMTLAFSPTTITYTATSTLTVTLTDSNADPVASTQVQLAVSSGPGTITATVTTDSNGQATAVYSPQNTVGTAVITATVPSYSLSDTESITVTAPTGTDRNVTFTPGNGYNRAIYPVYSSTPQSSILTFTVTDENNTPISGETVTFSVPNATQDTGSLSDSSVTTNALGQASTRFTANTFSGIVQILASTSTGNSTSALLTVGDGNPDLAHLSIYSRMYQDGKEFGGTAINLPGFVTDTYNGRIKVTLADHFGNPIGANWGVTAYSPYTGIISGDGTLSSASTVAAGTTDPTGTFELFFYPRIGQYFDPYAFIATTRDLVDGDLHDNGVTVPILIATSGSDSFQDVNANGVYDSGTDLCPLPGQLYCDLGTPYASQATPQYYSGSRIPVSNTTVAGTNTPFDANTDFWLNLNNASYQAPNGTRLANTKIWTVFRVTLSGSPTCALGTYAGSDFTELNDYSAALDATGALSRSFTLELQDVYGAPMAWKNVISVTGKGVTVDPSSQDTNGTRKYFGFSVTADNPGAGKKVAASVRVAINGPNTDGADVVCAGLSGTITGN